MNKEELAKIAHEKRLELIKTFYNQHKEKFEESALKGYLGYSIGFQSLDDDLKMALKVEEENLNTYIEDVDVKLKRTRDIIFNSEYIKTVVFSW